MYPHFPNLPLGYISLISLPLHLLTYPIHSWSVQPRLSHPAAVDIPTVQNEAYGRMSGAAVNTDTEEQNEMYDYVNN